MVFPRTGIAIAKSRASRHNRANVRCDDVKVDPAGSRRRIADRIGTIAAMSCSGLATRHRQPLLESRLRCSPSSACYRFHKTSKLVACVSDLHRIEVFHELHSLLP
jgi:hypothetical protein